MVTSNREVLAPFRLVAGNLALDFANTVHNWGAADPRDDLKTFSDLQLWAGEAGLVAGRWGRSPGELTPFKDLRDVVYQLFLDILHHGRPKPGNLARFNAHWQTAMAQTQVQVVDGSFRLLSASADPAERIRFEILHAAVELLRSGQLGRIRQCAGEACTWLFLDTSRNGSRRWCEMQACGNRAKVRRFRQHLGDQQ